MEITPNWNHNYREECLPNFSTNMEMPRHRWYEFKEGFGASLVERAIRETKKSKMEQSNFTVLDPFCGSGTTPLTALEQGHNAIGFEVNPFMRFVGNTKCKEKKKSSSEYHAELQWLLEQKPTSMESDLESFSTFSEEADKKKWLFNIDVLRAFEALRVHISKLEESDFFLLALISATMQCCNARKDGKCLRYIKNWENAGYTESILRQNFRKNALDMISDLDTEPLLIGDRNITQGDNRALLKTVSNESVDLIVFSPPYLNSFDYSDIYRPELFLGKFVDSNDALKLIREKTLRSHVQFKWKTADQSSSMWAGRVVSQIADKREKLWNPDIPEMIASYFYDMEIILRDTFRTAKRGAQLWFVVSTSAYVGVEIPVDLILADIASKHGWSLASINALRKLRTSSQCSDEEMRKVRLRESLVICRK